MQLLSSNDGQNTALEKELSFACSDVGVLVFVTAPVLLVFVTAPVLLVFVTAPVLLLIPLFHT